MSINYIPVIGNLSAKSIYLNIALNPYLVPVTTFKP